MPEIRGDMRQAQRPSQDKGSQLAFPPWRPETPPGRHLPSSSTSTQSTFPAGRGSGRCSPATTSCQRLYGSLVGYEYCNRLWIGMPYKFTSDPCWEVNKLTPWNNSPGGNSKCVRSIDTWHAFTDIFPAPTPPLRNPHFLLVEIADDAALQQHHVSDFMQAYGYDSWVP